MAKKSNPWAKLDALVAEAEEPIGNWFKPDEFAMKYGYSLSRAHRKLTDLWRAGKLDRWKGRGKGHSGGHIVKYRIKP